MDYETLKKLADTINFHKQAASKACDTGQYEQSAHHGSLSLQYESDFFCTQAAINVNLISFSLFGDDPLYCETAILNAKIMNKVYPNWVMRVYYDSSVPRHVLSRLEQYSIQLLNVADLGISHWPGTFWRFHAVTDPHVAKVQFRDADSIVSHREAQWVSAWEQSDLPFHVLRDWYSHTDLILAGLWGAYAPFLVHLPTWIEQYLKSTPQLHPTHADQMFLAKIVWPRIKPYCLTHDTVHNLSFATPIDSPRPGSHSSDALGGFKAKHLKVTVPENVSKYLVTLYDEQQKIVMQYERTAHNGQDSFHMPTDYYQHIESGKWYINYTSLPNYTVSVVSPASSPIIKP